MQAWWSACHPVLVAEHKADVQQREKLVFLCRVPSNLCQASRSRATSPSQMVHPVPPKPSQRMVFSAAVRVCWEAAGSWAAFRKPWKQRQWPSA